MKYFFVCLLLTIALIPSLCSAIDTGPQDPSALFSPEALKKMEQDAIQIKKELEEKNPAEYQKLLQLEKKLNEMSPEEQVQFLFMDEREQKAFIEKLTQELPPLVPTVPTQDPISFPTLPEVKEEEKKQEPKKVVVEPSKQEKTLSIIDGIINGTEGQLEEQPGFLRQIAMLKGYINENRLSKWAKQGKLKNWNPKYTWAEIKDQIEKLIGVLYKIKEPEKRGKEYKHLDELALDTGLVNNLEHLKNTLFTNLPLMKVQEAELSEETKSAIANIISAYIEAINITKLPDELKKVIEKYDPTAKKLTEEEKTATQKAIEQSKREPRYEPTVYGGVPESIAPYSYGGPSLPSYDYAPSYAPSYPSSDYDTPSYDFDRPESKRSEYGDGKSGEAFRDQIPEKLRTETDKEKDSAKEKKAEPKELVQIEKKEKKDKAAEELVKKFGSNISDAATIIEESDLFNLKEHLLSHRKKKPNVKMVKAIPEIIHKLNAATKNLSLLKPKLNKDTKNLIDDVTAYYSSYEDIFKKLSASISEAQSYISSASKEKQDAFLGKQKPSKKISADKDAKAKLDFEDEEEESEKQYGLADLIKSHDDLLKELNQVTSKR